MAHSPVDVSHVTAALAVLKVCASFISFQRGSFQCFQFGVSTFQAAEQLNGDRGFGLTCVGVERCVCAGPRH